MIKLSRREDYAVILVNELAQAYKQRVVPLSEVAANYSISPLFLRNLANDLRNAGVIKAVEGKTGGYYLTKDPLEIKMGDILGVFSKGQLLDCCPPNEKQNHNRRCPRASQCISGNVWRKLNKEFLNKVYNLSLHAFITYQPSA